MTVSGKIEVQCHAGYRGEETPRRLVLGDSELDVVDILDRWLSPDHRYFKCRCGDGATYILRHDVVQDEWELTFYERGATDAP